MVMVRPEDRMTLTRAVRFARLTSGLVLMLFTAAHLANLSAGLVSLAAMERLRPVLTGPWSDGVGGMLLGLSAILHAVLGLASLAARRSGAMSTTDRIQLLLGLAVVPLLVGHVLVTRVSYELSDAVSISYPLLLVNFWLYAPSAAIQQLAVVMVVWIHGGIGLHRWMHLQRWWPRVGWAVLLLLVGVPVLALLGFVEAGKEVLARMASDPAFRADMLADLQVLARLFPRLEAIKSIVLWVWAGCAGAALLFAVLRRLMQANTPVRVDYDGGDVASGRAGLSILELSRLAGIPHTSLCSGRGRCGTCRVRIVQGAENLSAVNPLERGLLHGAAGPVRLACQARLLAGAATVERLIPVDADPSAVHDPAAWIASRTHPAEAQ